MILRRIGVFSAAKIGGIILTSVAFVFGALWSLIIFLTSAAGGSMNNENGMFSMLFGIGAVIFLPLVYGLFGFVGTGIAALLYNLLAGAIGGIELEFEQPPNDQTTTPTYGNL